MAAEVDATLVLAKPRPVVRRYLLSRWVEAEKLGKVTARVLGGAVAAVGLGTQSLDTLITAHDVATTDAPDVDFASTGQEAFEVDVYGQVWRYELDALDEQTTRLHMVYRQTSFMAWVPGNGALMRTSVRRESERIERWASRG